MRIVRVRVTRCGRWFPALLCTVLLGGACRTSPPVPEIELLLARPPIDVHTSSAAQIWEAARRFYEARELRLAWSSTAPTRRADEALAVLRSAEDHGLEPADYAVESLDRLRQDLKSVDGDTDEGRTRLAEFDVRLTNALLSLGKDVSVGRRRSRTVHPNWRAARRLPDLAASLETASQGSMDGWLETIQPPHRGYDELRAALGQLRALASEGGWPTVSRAALRTGQRGEAVRRLRHRLQAAGEMPADSSGSDLFDGAVEKAVRSFQYHHGLPATGRVDAATRDAMNVPLATRLRHVTLNVERWRWLPDDLGDRHIRVNVPQFYLEGFDAGRRTLDIRVVVGKRGNETPLFSDEMTHVVFSPYWNIPDSIASGETLPGLIDDGTYLSRNNIEVVRVVDDRAETVDPADVDWLDEQARQDLRFRQRPGVGNALGLVKFLFPNRHSVYIHDTPADKLFSRLGRMFSHGCVRVEDPVALASWVLARDANWTRPAIRQAMHGGTERHVRLAHRIPVHLVYFTAWIDEGGGLNFRSDVYGYDARQARLTGPSPATQRASR